MINLYDNQHYIAYIYLNIKLVKKNELMLVDEI